MHHLQEESGIIRIIFMCIDKFLKYWNKGVDKIIILLFIIIALSIIGLLVLGVMYLMSYQDFTVLKMNIKTSSLSKIFFDIAEASTFLLIGIELADKISFSQPNVEMGLYIPHPHDKIQVNYCDKEGKFQKDYLIGSKPLDKVVLKAGNIIKNETICFCVRAHGRKLDMVSCYVSDYDRDNKIRNNEENTLVEFSKLKKNPWRTLVKINPKKDAVIVFDHVIHQHDVLIIPLSFSIKNAKKRTHNIYFELTSQNTVRPIIVKNLQLTIK